MTLCPTPTSLFTSAGCLSSTLRLCFLDLLLPGVPLSRLKSRLFFSLLSLLTGCSDFGGEPVTAFGESFVSWSVQFSGCESLSALLELSSLCLSTPRSAIQLYQFADCCGPSIKSRSFRSPIQVYIQLVAFVQRPVNTAKKEIETRRAKIRNEKSWFSSRHWKRLKANCFG